MRGKTVKISDRLGRNSVFAGLSSKTKPEVLRELSEKMAGAAAGLNPERVNEVLREREKLCSTAVDSGVAIVQGKLPDVPRATVGFATSAGGVDFGSVDGEKTRLFAVVLAPEDSAEEYLELLARAAKILGRGETREKLLRAREASEIYDIVIQEDERL